MSKKCMQTNLGGNVMRITALAVFTAFISFSAYADESKFAYLNTDDSRISTQKVERGGQVDVAATCFFQYEQTSGMNKICFYDCLGSSYAITVSAVSLCPLSINR